MRTSADSSSAENGEDSRNLAKRFDEVRTVSISRIARWTVDGCGGGGGRSFVRSSASALMTNDRATLLIHRPPNWPAAVGAASPPDPSRRHRVCVSPTSVSDVLFLLLLLLLLFRFPFLTEFFSEKGRRKKHTRAPVPRLELGGVHFRGVDRVFGTFFFFLISNNEQRTTCD